MKGQKSLKRIDWFKNRGYLLGQNKDKYYIVHPQDGRKDFDSISLAEQYVEAKGKGEMTIGEAIEILEAFHDQAACTLDATSANAFLLGIEALKREGKKA